VDFFSLGEENIKTRYFKEDIYILAFLLKKVWDILKEFYCEDNPEKLKTIFEENIGFYKQKKAKWPHLHTSWQFRLYALSVCPQVFTKQIKKMLWALFDVDSYRDVIDVISVAEYEWLLQRCFNSFNSREQKLYKNRILTLFNFNQGKDRDKKKYARYRGALLMCRIGEKKKAKEVFGLDCDELRDKPTPAIQRGIVYTIVPKEPVSQEEFNKMIIEEIVKKLKNEWTPENLEELNKMRNHDEAERHPINIEGLGNLIQNRFKKDFENMITHAPMFFDRDRIHSHYTYAFLRGAQENISQNKNTDFTGLMKLLKKICLFGENRPFVFKEDQKESIYDTWRANRTTVHQEMADVLQKLLDENDGKIAVGFKKSRDDIFEILKYLLNYPHPKPDDESPENPILKIKKQSGDYRISDPYTLAINTVRGRAFQAFLLFIYQDGKKLKDDVWKFYKEMVTNEKTGAMMFMYSHHLPSFYFRNKIGIKKDIIPILFKNKNTYLCKTAIEGYLAQNIYREMFEDKDIKKLYSEWVDLEDTDYKNQEHFKDIDEGLTQHLVLAFVHFNLKLEDEPLKKFWDSKHSKALKRKKEFVTFLGRHAILSENVSQYMKEIKGLKKKLKDFWGWVLKNCNDSEVFEGFGFWINPDKEVLEDTFVIEQITKSLQKSKGVLEWDYGLMSRLEHFAKVDLKTTIKAIRAFYLSERSQENHSVQWPMQTHIEAITRVLREAEKHDKELRAEAEKLKSDLIKNGGRVFWKLEEKDIGR